MNSIKIVLSCLAAVVASVVILLGIGTRSALCGGPAGMLSEAKEEFSPEENSFEGDFGNSLGSLREIPSRNGGVVPKIFGGMKNRPARVRATRDFVLYCYFHIADDAIKGKGQYLDALYELLGIEEARKVAFRAELLQILLDNNRIPDFSKRVAEFPESR